MREKIERAADAPALPPPEPVRWLVIVAAIVLIVVSSVVGVVQEWAPADVSRVWVGAIIVALWAAGLRAPPGGGGSSGVAMLLAQGGSAFFASEGVAALMGGG